MNFKGVNVAPIALKIALKVARPKIILPLLTFPAGTAARFLNGASPRPSLLSTQPSGKNFSWIHSLRPNRPSCGLRSKTARQVVCQGRLSGVVADVCNGRSLQERDQACAVCTVRVCHCTHVTASQMGRQACLQGCLRGYAPSGDRAEPPPKIMFHSFWIEAAA